MTNREWYRWQMQVAEDARARMKNLEDLCNTARYEYQLALDAQDEAQRACDRDPEKEAPCGTAPL